MAFISQTKHFGHTVSIGSGSNKITTCSQGSWDMLKEGNSSISFGDDGILYKVANKKRATILKDVEVFDSDKLRINESVTYQLCPSDLLVFTHEQYKIGEIVEIKNKGFNYSVGDTLIPSNATAKYNTFDDTEQHAEFLVEEVVDEEGPEKGGVKSLKVIKSGVYNSFLSDDVEFGGGSGGGLIVNCRFELLQEIFNEERSIIDIEVSQSPSGPYSILCLDNPLPPKVLKGQIKTEKWFIYLNVNYEGQPKINTPYSIVKDFTKNSKLPLIVGDIHNSRTLYNESMSILDAKIQNLNSLMETLGTKIDDCVSKFENLETAALNISNINKEDIEDLKGKYDQIGDVFIETGQKSKASFITLGQQVDGIINEVNKLKGEEPVED